MNADIANKGSVYYNAILMLLIKAEIWKYIIKSIETFYKTQYLILKLKF